MDTTQNSDLSDEKIQGHWEIKSRNELIVTEHQSSSEYVLYYTNNVYNDELGNKATSNDRGFFFKIFKSSNNYVCLPNIYNDFKLKLKSNFKVFFFKSISTIQSTS